MPTGSRRFSGLLDLCPEDLYSIFRGQEVALTEFQSSDGGYARLADDHAPHKVRKEDLLIRLEERDRFEVERNRSVRSADAPTDGAFRASADYRHVQFKGKSFRFGPIQAAVVCALHKASLSKHPWQNGKSILEQAGSQSFRMSDIFKSQPGWRDLIWSDRRGSYRLGPD